MRRAIDAVRPEVTRVLEYARPDPARLGGSAGLRPGEVARAAIAGALLLGLAFTALGYDGALEVYSIEKNTAAVSVRMHWGYSGIGFMAVGLLVGAAFGAIVAVLAWTVGVRRGAGSALLAVGVICGLTAGATWGEAVARERQFEVRAQPPQTKAVPVPRGAAFNVVNGTVRVHGTVLRTMNYPLLAFMAVAGATLGALAARGLADLSLARIGLRDQGDEGPAAGDAVGPREASCRAA